ncbi:MAG: hypothetical protein JO036_14915 [Candidatus Eremiobacteraeota bacterium]|nr:hypothetical protein [Candidatus Eremiobacteraeota bacterium]
MPAVGKVNAVRDFLIWFTGTRLCVFLSWYGRKLMRALGDVWICAYAFIAVVLLNVAIPRTAQGIELGNALINFPPSKQILMALALLYCAIGIWIAASTSLTNAARITGKALPFAGRLDSTVPFWFGGLVFLSAIGLVWGNPTYHFGPLNVDAATILNVVALLVLLAIPFAPYSFAVTPKTPRALHGTRLAAHALHEHLANHRTTYEIALIAIGFAISVAVITAGPPVARTLGTWVLVYVAFGFWALWGSRVFIAWPRLVGWPSLWALPIAWALLISNWNDNHEIDGGAYGAPAPARRSFETAVNDWRRTHNCTQQHPCPLRIVAAEGGGLRAAFWTAEIFAQLDKHTTPPLPKFSSTVFAVSSISGGSLGTLAYFAGTKLAENNPKCNPDCFLPAYLGDDHLSPVMAGLVFGNAFQWLWPWSIPQLDRAKAFEANMSQRWIADLGCEDGTNVFEARFPTDMPEFPVLLMNSTNVETGKRFILGTVAKPSDRRQDNTRGVIGIDTYWAFDDQSLRLKSLPARTAVTLSASFPLVTPAGTAYEHDSGGNRGRLWGRLVDGGYFDGTGLVTAYDIANEVRALDKPPAAKVSDTFHVSIVFISNDPSSAAGWENARDDVPDPPNPPSRMLITTNVPDDRQSPNPNLPAHPPWNYEAEAITSGAVNAHWEAAIEYARRQLVAFRKESPEQRIAPCAALFEEKARKGDDFCEISLGLLLRHREDPRPALGWFLSKTSQQLMTEKARCYVDVLKLPQQHPNGLDDCEFPTQLR